MNYYFDDYENSRWESYKTSLQSTLVKNLIATTMSEQNLDMLATVLCRAYLEEDKIAEKLFAKAGIDDLQAYAMLGMDTELFQEIQNERVS